VVEVFILRKAAAIKQGVQKQTWQLAVEGYAISCQLSCGGRPSTAPKEIAGCRDPGLGEEFLILFPTLIFFWASLSGTFRSWQCDSNQCVIFIRL
jgi:hypothetical protein